MAHRRGRTFHGAREILEDPSWSGRLGWLDRSGFKRSSHRPDLIGFTPNGGRFAIEVELASKSKTRLDTILRLHQTWIIRGRTGGVIYICRDDDGRRRIAQAGDRVGSSSTTPRPPDSSASRRQMLYRGRPLPRQVGRSVAGQQAPLPVDRKQHQATSLLAPGRLPGVQRRQRRAPANRRPLSARAGNRFALAYDLASLDEVDATAVRRQRHTPHSRVVLACHCSLSRPRHRVPGRTRSSAAPTIGLGGRDRNVAAIESRALREKPRRPDALLIHSDALREKRVAGDVAAQERIRHAAGIQVPPALDAMVLDLQVASSAARADRQRR
jgi:hypothetical protein